MLRDMVDRTGHYSNSDLIRILIDLSRPIELTGAETSSGLGPLRPHPGQSQKCKKEEEEQIPWVERVPVEQA